MVIGASSGGMEALKLIAGKLPPRFAAAMFAVMHLPDVDSQLPKALGQRSSIPVCYAEDGDAIRTGQLMVARPRRHLLLKNGHVLLGRGPRENSWRPSIDALFRSAAVAYGPRAIGIVLSGMLDDGSAGLHAIHRCGGIAIVQDPMEAEFSEMPASALNNVPQARVLKLAEIAAALPALVQEPAAEPGPIPADLALEVRIAEGDSEASLAFEPFGEKTDQICPECGGPLELADDGSGLFRCRVGHAYSAQTLAHENRHDIESSLWTAVRLLQQRANLARLREKQERNRGRNAAAQSYSDRAAESERHANVLRTVLMGLPE